jgi:hypothetical protein
MHSANRFLRRKDAATYLKNKYGHGSPRTLAKLACLGGGPEMVYVGRNPYYTEQDLDAWALSKMSAPVRTTSARRTKVA